MIQGIYYHAILSYFSASLPDTMEQGMALDDKAATLENAEIMNETKNDRITQHAHKICLALSKTTQVVFDGVYCGCDCLVNRYVIITLFIKINDQHCFTIRRR